MRISVATDFVSGKIIFRFDYINGEKRCFTTIKMDDVSEPLSMLRSFEIEDSIFLDKITGFIEEVKIKEK